MRLTILTPVYNRKSIIENLYRSLKTQTVKEFNWLVVDDGSTDDLSSLVDEWKIQTKDFLIEYLKKQNGGKHRAINYAIPHVKTDYVMIVDSDDILTNDAIENINKWIEEIDHDDLFAGVSGLLGKNKYDLIGDFPKRSIRNGYIDAKNTERGKSSLEGDKAEVYRTDLLKKNPFPEFEGENFISECVVWNEIAFQGYKIRWFNKIIMITEYLNDGLTKNLHEIRLSNFHGYTLEMKSILRANDRKTNRRLGRYILLAKEKGYTGKKIRYNLDVKMMKYFFGWICSILQVLKDGIKKRR